MTLTHKITVAVPAIPIRQRMLTARALPSVAEQTYPAAGISVSIDHDRLGAPRNRNKALDGVTTEWVAFLDDDDTLMPQHLQRLVEHQQETGADLVFPWFTIVDIAGTEHLEWDPFPQHFGREWNITPDNLDEIRQFPITILARTELLRSVGGFTPVTDDGAQWDGNRAGEDLMCWIECVKAGAKISHLPERTWHWLHWGVSSPERPIGNTSGMASRW